MGTNKDIGVFAEGPVRVRFYDFADGAARVELLGRHCWEGVVGERGRWVMGCECGGLLMLI